MQDAVEAIEKRMTSFEQQWREGAKQNKIIIDAMTSATNPTLSANSTDLVQEVREANCDFVKSVNMKIDDFTNRVTEKLESERHDLLAIASASDEFPTHLMLEIMDEVKQLSTTI